MSPGYFNDYLALLTEEIVNVEAEVGLPEEESKQEMVHFDLFKYRNDVLLLSYSRGANINVMAKSFSAIVDALEAYKQHPRAEDFFFNGEQDEYMQAVELLSLAVLLHVDTEVFKRLVVAIGANGQDYLLDWLVARRLPARRPATTKLLFPKTYARLRDAIQAPPDLQPRLLRAFLAGWYESLDTVWYDCHLAPEGGGFTGYWCWEAAAVAYCLGLDDAELQPMPYYPADLADYAFGRKPRLSA